MELSEEEYDRKYEEFKTEMMGVLNKWAPIIGPQNGDMDVEINDQQTVATDAVVVVNWMDLDTSNSFLVGHILTKTNPSMLIGMLWRTTKMMAE